MRCRVNLLHVPAARCLCQPENFATSLCRNLLLLVLLRAKAVVVWQLENGREERMFKRLSDEYIFRETQTYLPVLVNCSSAALTRVALQSGRTPPFPRRTTVGRAQALCKGTAATQILAQCFD